MGYSPLTGEKLTPEEPNSVITWCDIVAARWSFRLTNINTGNQTCKTEIQDEWCSWTQPSQVERRLIVLISGLPPLSLARAKAALALGLSYLHGVENFRDEKATVIINATSPLDRGTGVRPKLRRGRKALQALTEQLRIAEMLLFEATCVLEQHTATEPVLPFYPCLCKDD